MKKTLALVLSVALLVCMFPWPQWLPTPTTLKTGTSGFLRVWRGGCWLSDADSCRIYSHGYYEQYGVAPDQGLRVCRNG